MKYDLAVIGGGVAGVAVAREAARSGLSVVLLERAYLAAGTSSKSSRLIHGGIRYLETAAAAVLRGRFGEALQNTRFVFAALGECRRIEKEFPDLARPLPILIPVYRGDKRKLFWIAAGAYLYAGLAALTGPVRWPKVYNSQASIKKVPGLRAEGLRGCVQIWERVTRDAELVRRIGAQAREAGAVIAEHTPVNRFVRGADGSFQIFTDSAQHSGEGSVYSARAVANASGPWIDSLRRRSGAAELELIEPVAGAHIEIEDFLPASLLLQAGDDRFFFCIQVGNGRLRVGTTERKIDDPDRVTATDIEIEYLLDGLRKYFPGQKWDYRTILGSDAGTRPLAKEAGGGSLNAISREHRIVEEPAGVFHLTGVKLTDHRRAAIDSLHLIRNFLNKK